MTQRFQSTATLERPRHPALYLRTETVDRCPEPPPRTDGGIFAALIEASQLHTDDYRRSPSRRQFAARDRAIDELKQYGFRTQDIADCCFGIYPTTEDARDWLHRAEFSDHEIADSGLIEDEQGRPRRDWEGCVIVPVENEDGRVVDVAAIIPTSRAADRTRFEFAMGFEKSGVPVCCLSRASRSPQNHWVLVDDIRDAFALQCRGYDNVVAIGGCGDDFTSSRWQDLAHLGVRSVTLAFRNDSTCRRDVRDSLENALKARTAPEISVLDHTQLQADESLADVARKHGIDACHRAVEHSTLAYHRKDFGAPVSRRPEPPRRPEPRRPESPVERRVERPMNGIDNLRTWLREEADRIHDSAERHALLDLIFDVDDALRRGHYSLARDLVASRMGDYRPREEPRPRHTQAAATDVLDRLCDTRHRGAVAEELLPHTGTPITAGQITVLSSDTARGRMSELCDRLVIALEESQDQCVVVCREFTDEEILLGTLAHMVRRMTNGGGLSVEEIRSRLSGQEPRDGYADKPWLVDEAVDKLRQWNRRITFVTGADVQTRIVTALDRIAADSDIGSVFLDSVPAAWEFESRWDSHASAFVRLRDFQDIADRFGCAVTVVSRQEA